MPVHDWTRITAGTFHAFHNAWISSLQEALNDGRMPEATTRLASSGWGTSVRTC